MDIPDDQIAELKILYGEVQRAMEGGIDYFLLPGLRLPDGCAPRQTDALLCPTQRDGYPSRLFFADKPTSRTGRNWNAEARILERNWYAFSWKPSKAEPLRLAQMIQMHLRGLR